MTRSVATPSQTRDAVLADLLDRLTVDLKAGKSPDLDVLVRDHPDLADELRQLYPAAQMMADLSRFGEPGASAPGDVPLGDLGDYTLIREVGRGGMGVVYEAEQRSLRRRVALKVLPWAAAMDPKQLQRFKNEALAAASLRHDHIVQVHAVGCERGVHYYAMEFIEGQTLAQVIDGLRPGGEPAAPGMTQDYAAGGESPTPPVAALTTKRTRPRGREFHRRAAALIADAADALEHAHSLGIVHRDVKPGNLLVDGSGKVYVSDFGLARFGTDAGLTMSGDVIGTLRYMAPEQALAKHGLADHRVDVYGLGATLYELLTGRPAVQGEDKADILGRIAFDDPVPPRTFDKAIPAELETVALKCLAKEPSERYGTARELAEDLRRWLADRAIAAKPPSLRYRIGKWAARHRAFVAVTLAFLTVATAGLAAAVVLLNAANRQEARQRERAQENLRTAMEALHETAWPANSPGPWTPATPEETRRLE
jgi:hypothetical protein